MAKNAVVCDTYFSRLIGLMFSRRIRNKGLIFVFPDERVVSFHMMFVFFPIDMLFLDEKKRVVELVERAMPFTPIIRSQKKVRYVVELPENTIQRCRTRVGDSIGWR